MCVITLLDERAPGADHGLIDLPQAVQAQVDRIVESFERVSIQE